MGKEVKLVIDWQPAARFTIKSFASLLLVLGVYALVKRHGAILSISDIQENFIYILGIYVVINLISLISIGSIRLSSGSR
jgi:hypothetical protein